MSVSQYEHEFDNVSRHIDGQPHRLHYEVLVRHSKRLVKVYKCIATDHGLPTLARIDKKPSKTQRAIRQGAEQTANEVKQTDDDAVMASSTNEPTAQKEAARKEYTHCTHLYPVVSSFATRMLMFVKTYEF